MMSFSTLRASHKSLQRIVNSLTVKHFGKRQFSSSSALRSEKKRYEQSYSQGSSDVPLQGVTIGKLMEQAAEKYGSREAFVSCHQDLRYTFEDLLEKSDQLAAGLLSVGVRPGDRVGIWAPNCMEWILIQYATARAGMILVNINPAYRPAEMEYALRKVGVKALIASETFKTSNYYNMLLEIVPEIGHSDPGRLKADNLPELNHIIMIGDKDLPGTFKFDDVIHMESRYLRGKVLDLQANQQFDDPINIQFTSGTTGLPKGALLTHHNIVNNAYFVGKTLGYEKENGVIMNPVPLYHCFGMVLGSMMSVMHGAKVIMSSGSFDPVSAVEALHNEKCTAVYGTPTMFIDMLEVPQLEKYDFSSLRTGIMAGSPCPIEVMKQVINVFGCSEMTIAYGTTENSPVTFQTATDDPLEKRVSTVGKVHPQTEAKIIDEKGRIVPVGEKGELCTRGYCVMRGYWHDPEKTAQVIGEDRWYHSGDLAIMDEEGYVAIVGRLKDMIIRGGENIYPTEIEQFLYKHPKISDVQVIGVPDQRMGEQLCAWIKLKDNETATQNEIREFCKGQVRNYSTSRNMPNNYNYESIHSRERSLIMVKPDGVQRGITGEIIKRFEERGFRMCAMKVMWAREDYLEKHYVHLKDKPFFGTVIEYMTSGPVVPMVWEGKDIIQLSRQMLGNTDPTKAGPGTIRGDYGTCIAKNICHASDGIETSRKEIDLWFAADEIISWDKQDRINHYKSNVI